MQKPRFLVLTLMVLAAALSRLLPHPPNFTPMIPLALFGAAYFSGRAPALLVPLAAMVVSDLLLNLVLGYPLFSFMRIVVYGCFMAIAVSGFTLRDQVQPGRVITLSIAGSTLFYLVTNLAVWLGGDGLTYPLTGEGLIACYIAGIPFFGNEIAGSLFYSALLFGGFEVMKRHFPGLVLARSRAVVISRRTPS